MIIFLHQKIFPNFGEYKPGGAIVCQISCFLDEIYAKNK